MASLTSSFNDVYYCPVSAEDLPTIIAIESASYPPDEAATEKTLNYRFENAPDYFLIAHEGDDIIGYVCGTVTSKGALDHATMFTHDPDGATLCVHSVCVKESLRRRKMGSRLLHAYVNYINKFFPAVQDIRLLCKENLISFYQGAGFSVIGPSSVVHGADRWIEMSRKMAADDASRL